MRYMTKFLHAKARALGLSMLTGRPVPVFKAGKGWMVDRLPGPAVDPETVYVFVHPSAERRPTFAGQVEALRRRMALVPPSPALDAVAADLALLGTSWRLYGPEPIDCRTPVTAPWVLTLEGPGGFSVDVAGMVGAD